MLRRTFLNALMGGAAAIALAGCNMPGSDTEVSVQSIVDYLRDKCQFTTTVDAVVSVIITVVTSFDAGAGATALVAKTVADTVEKLICDAVERQVAQHKALRKAAPAAGEELKVVVNGKTISGKYAGK